MYIYLAMAGADPGAREAIRDRREEICMDGEPLNASTRKAQQFQESIYVNITTYAEKTHDIIKGEEVQVETYKEGIFIRTTNDSK